MWALPLPAQPPQRSARRGFFRRLGDAALVVVGPAEESGQQQDVIRRALMAPAIIIIAPIEQLHIPGWPAVVAACAAALLYDIPLAYLVFIKKRFFTARVLAFVLDGLLLSSAGLIVLSAMGAANSASDIWLAFLVFVVSGGFVLAPIGAMVYTGLTMGWFALGTLLYFPDGSQYREELLIRLVFFATFGLISMAMSAELAKRRRRLEVQNRQTMGMLAKLVEARDTDAGAHLHRIQYFSRALALHLGLSDREAQEIAYASMIHDVGKANVPDAVLKKPGPLNAEEWRLMKEHTALGDQLLTENSDFAMAREVARWHHERWDGSGYPDGLKAEEIPLAARIVAVADVFDALISKRPYKEAWPPEAAIQELRRVAGTHLDLRIVASFVELWKRGEITHVADQVEGPETIAPPPLERAA